MKIKISLFVFGCLFSFMMGLGIHHGYAKYVNPELYMGPKVENVSNVNNGVNCQEYWHNGTKYLIFTSGYSSMQVVKVN